MLFTGGTVSGGSGDTGTYAVVSGAGVTSVNGTYTPRGTFNGKPYYNKQGEPTDIGAWSIYFLSNKWYIASDSTDEYISTDTATFPWTATWEEFSGSPPAPTVTQL